MTGGGTRITTGRKSRAEKQTWCTSCEAWIGVRIRSYERNNTAYSQQDTAKIVGHLNKNGRLCHQSNLAIPMSVVMDA